jgi:nucleoside-diphosphate-sugar epimerase
MRQHANNQSLTITGDGEQRRDFISVDDVVKANVLASWSEKVGDGESINIGNGEAISINKVAKLISDDIVYVEKRYEPDITLADITKAKELLDWNPQVDFRNWLTKYKDNQN